MDLPIFLLDIDEDLQDDTAVNYVALVDNPAIEKCWQKFNARPVAFVADAEKQIISGPLMIADMPIYRRDEEYGEYYTVFTGNTIEKIIQKYFAKGFQNNVNLMHKDGTKLDGIGMFESWQVDRDKGKMPLKGYEDVACGSWFGSFKVTNPVVWQMVKDDLVKGFSVEGMFNFKRKTETKEDELIRKIEDILSQVE
jgi:hypothetical protein